MLNPRNIITVREKKRHSQLCFTNVKTVAQKQTERTYPKKCNSLCTKFRKEMKRINNSEKSGTGSEGVFVLFCFHKESKSNGHTSSICITHHVRTPTNYCTTWLNVLFSHFTHHVKTVLSFCFLNTGSVNGTVNATWCCGVGKGVVKCLSTYPHLHDVRAPLADTASTHFAVSATSTSPSLPQ